MNDGVRPNVHCKFITGECRSTARKKLEAQVNTNLLWLTSRTFTANVSQVSAEERERRAQESSKSTARQ